MVHQNLSFGMCIYHLSQQLNTAGVYYDEDPPVPIPNTVVKLIYAEDTWRVTARENRSSPALYLSIPVSLRESIDLSIYSSIAQLVEHAAVNRRVVGSSPTWGAITIRETAVSLHGSRRFL